MCQTIWLLNWPILSSLSLCSAITIDVIIVDSVIVLFSLAPSLALSLSIRRGFELCKSSRVNESLHVNGKSQNRNEWNKTRYRYTLTHSFTNKLTHNLYSILALTVPPQSESYSHKPHTHTTHSHQLTFTHATAKLTISARPDRLTDWKDDDDDGDGARKRKQFFLTTKYWSCWAQFFADCSRV